MTLNKGELLGFLLLGSFGILFGSLFFTLFMFFPTCLILGLLGVVPKSLEQLTSGLYYLGLILCTLCVIGFGYENKQDFKEKEEAQTSGGSSP